MTCLRSAAFLIRNFPQTALDCLYDLPTRTSCQQAEDSSICDSTDGGEPRALTSGSNLPIAARSTDGNVLAFVSAATANSQMGHRKAEDRPASGKKISNISNDAMLRSGRPTEMDAFTSEVYQDARNRRCNNKQRKRAPKKGQGKNRRSVVVTPLDTWKDAKPAPRFVFSPGGRLATDAGQHDSAPFSWVASDYILAGLKRARIRANTAKLKRFRRNGNLHRTRDGSERGASPREFAKT